VLKDPACSLAVSSYLLCALTATVFIATLRGAQGAWEALYDDRRVMLAIDPIDEIVAGTPFVEFRLDELEDGFVQGSIASARVYEYDSTCFACMNVGKTPFIHGVLQVNNSDQVPLELRVGSIKAGESIFLKIWIRSAVGSRFHWFAAKSEAHRDIELFAEQRAWRRVRYFAKSEVRGPA
jgi:hypothetical protein